MLTQYQQITRRLLNDSSFVRFNDFDLRDWINIARSQVAAECEAIHAYGQLNTIVGSAVYGFSSVVITSQSPTGLLSPLTIRQIRVNGVLLSPRSWDWMFEYYVDANMGTPVDWGQLGQGSLGSFFLGPTPSTVWTVKVDCIMLPTNLNIDADPETLPYPFRDAVPYFAAYMAQISAQDFDAAERMYALYERFAMRARKMAVPTVLPDQFPGAVGAQHAAAASTLAPMSNGVTPTRGGAPS